MSKKGDENREEKQRYRLAVPLDATHLEDLRETKSQALQVAARLSDGTVSTEPVDLAEGEDVAELEFDERPDGVGVAVGPERATPEELLNSQTLMVNVPRQRWDETPEVELDPIEIPAFHWDWWYRMCREFVIRGKLECPDGSPVPGAKVCAKDVNSFFVWSSTQEVGCDTTDQNGTFEIRFRWCCGFWPRWWWANRTWQPDPVLVEQVQPAIEAEPDLPLGGTGPQPDLNVFEDVLDDPSVPVDTPLAEVDPNRLERVRTQLNEQLTDVPELRRLNVWPWVRWTPWWDCNPDIIFEATQAGDVVLDEDIRDTRWDISSTKRVELTANEDALCIPPACEDPPCEHDECLHLTAICERQVSNVGGNRGAPSSPKGYLNPGSPSAGTARHSGDRPFAETVTLWRGGFGLQNVDYIEVEYNDGTGWNPVPANGVEDFKIPYSYLPSPGAKWKDTKATFNFTTIGGHRVVKTREYHEDQDTSTLWYLESVRKPRSGTPDAMWGHDRDLLVPINSDAFKDGTYRFRIVGWDKTGPNELSNRRVLTRCGEGDRPPAEVVLTFDNRGKRSRHHRHPNTPPGTTPDWRGKVHKSFIEPDTAIMAVRINGTEVAEDEERECPSVEEQEGTLEIDFLARDGNPKISGNPTGHLSHYTLQATYGRSKKRDLLNQPSSTIKPLPAGSSPPPYPGPEYGQALAQGATRPEWNGGKYRLTVDLDEAFPKPCCYQLELRAWKRTLVDCDDHHWNISEYTIGFGV